MKTAKTISMFQSGDIKHKTDFLKKKLKGHTKNNNIADNLIPVVYEEMFVEKKEKRPATQEEGNLFFDFFLMNLYGCEADAPLELFEKVKNSTIILESYAIPKSAKRRTSYNVSHENLPKLKRISEELGLNTSRALEFVIRSSCQKLYFSGIRKGDKIH